MMMNMTNHDKMVFAHLDPQEWWPVYVPRIDLEGMGTLAIPAALLARYEACSAEHDAIQRELRRIMKESDYDNPAD